MRRRKEGIERNGIKGCRRGNGKKKGVEKKRRRSRERDTGNTDSAEWRRKGHWGKSSNVDVRMKAGKSGGKI